MIIIRIQGGLGNQLFQYALYERFRISGIEAKLDVSAYRDGSEARPLELDKLGLMFETAQQDELHRYFADNTKIADKICRYVLGRKKYLKERRYDFDPQILAMTDGFLSGYWQSEKYFDKAAPWLREHISFQGIDTDAVRQRVRQMQNGNSVSIHVRLGDYLQNQGLYGNICTAAYYEKAMQYITDRVADPVFYVFSDEPERAAELLSGYDFYTIIENTGDNSYKDMYLMSCCRHHIIANSSFSWWGAWLDGKPDKIVITPSKWNHLCRTNGICCDGWVSV